MFKYAMFALALVLSMQSTLVGGEEVQSELEKLNGTWQLVSAKTGIREEPDVTPYTLVIRNGRQTLFHFRNAVLKESPFTINPQTSPATFVETNYAQRECKGIYKLDGETLTICTADRLHLLPPEDPPREFATKPGSSHFLRVYRRMTQAEAELALLTYMPLTYRSEKTGIMLYVERDREHVSAVDKDGKLLWHKHLTKGWKYDHRPTPRVQIVTVSKPRDRDLSGANEELEQPKGSDYVEISDNCTGFGLLCLQTGAYLHLGND